MTRGIASVTRRRVYNLLEVDHGGPLGLLHESAYIPMVPGVAQKAQEAQAFGPPDPSDPYGPSG